MPENKVLPASLRPSQILVHNQRNGHLQLAQQLVRQVFDRGPVSVPVARFFREGEAVSRLYGVQHAPTSTADFFAMGRALEARFEPHPIILEFLQIIQSGRAAPSD